MRADCAHAGRRHAAIAPDLATDGAWLEFRSGRRDVTTIALRAVLGLAAAAVTLGCNNTPAPASAARGQLAGERSRELPPPGSRIVGVVLLSSTGKPPTRGGVVYIEDAAKQEGVATTAAINIDHKEFTPFISVITTGGKVTFGNKDGLAHHVFSTDAPTWDTGYLRKNEAVAKTFDSPGAVALLCNIHPEMLGYLLVIPSTYFGKVGADGSYAVANVPPGTYRVTAWAPRAPRATQSIMVGPAGVVTANFSLPADGK
jgi:plastocyanin